MMAVTRVASNKEGDGEGAREGGMIYDNFFLGGKTHCAFDCST